MTSQARFVVKELDSDLMLYDGEKDEVHILNQTARSVYKLISEGKTQEQIVEVLRKTSHVQDGDPVEDDVRACIEALIQKGLVEKR